LVNSTVYIIYILSMQDINAPVVVVVVDVVVVVGVVVFLLLLKVPVPTFCMYVSLYSDILKERTLPFR